MDELKPCQTDEVGKLVEATAQTLDERCKIWQETLNRAYKDGKYNKNTGIWEADEYRVARARYTLDAYCDALALADTLGQQIDDIRRSAPENKLLTVEQVKQLNLGALVTIVEYGEIKSHGRVDFNIGADFWGYGDIADGTVKVYARKPEQEAAP